MRGVRAALGRPLPWRRRFNLASRRPRAAGGDDGAALQQKQGEAVAVKETVYPDNLTVGNLAFFTVAPTLCYEMEYPRKPSINWR